MLFYWLLFGIFLNDTFLNIGPLALVFPVLLFLISYFRKEKLFLPKIPSIFYLLFILFSSVSATFAIDRQAAFETTLGYLAAFFVFIYSFNNRNSLKKFIKPFLIYSSLIFISLVLLGKGAGIFSQQYLHNQLGNFLVLAAVISFSTYYWFFTFIFFILFSYSRSAYAALSTIIFLFFYKKKPLVALVSLLVLGFFFLATSGVVKFKELNLNRGKDLLGKRNVYIGYALSGIREKPLFGVGPGNFYFISLKRQLFYNENTTTAHNIILDILAENGLIAGIFFLLFAFFVIKKAKKDTYFYSFIALTIIFLLDYTYRFNSMLFLWFVLLGIVVEDREKAEINPLLTVLIMAAFLIPNVIFQKNVDNPLVARQLAKKYGSIYFYEKSLKSNPFLVVNDPGILDELFFLYTHAYGRYVGREKMTLFLNNDLNKNVYGDNPVVHRIIYFCETNELKCYNYFTK